MPADPNTQAIVQAIGDGAARIVLAILVSAVIRSLFNK